MSDPTPLEGIVISADADLGGQLVAVQDRPTLEIFTTPGLVLTLCQAIAEEAKKGYNPSTATDKARKAIASQAYRVAQTKTYLDNLGKDEVARLKELPRQIDAARKVLRDELDALRDELRRPLTDWEAEQERTKRRLAIIRNTPGDLMTSRADSVAIQTSIETLQAQPTTEAEWGEFAAEAASVKMLALSQLEQMLEDTRKREAEAAELERLRKEKAERDRLDREEQLRKEGEERARKAAEAAAQTAQVPAENPTSAPIPANPAAASVQNPDPFTGQPVRPNPTAVLSSDVEHRRTYNREAIADLLQVLAGDQAAAENVLRAIVTGKIRHISIEY